MALAQTIAALSIGTFLIVQGPLVAQQNTTTVKTRNSAFSLPMGQGLDELRRATLAQLILDRLGRRSRDGRI